MSEPLPYYSFDKVNSFNAPWNFVCGARGLGKTYGATRDAVRKFVRTGAEFIYLRRFHSELDSRVTFFSEIGQEFPEWDFRVEGLRGVAAHISTRDSEKREWSTVCYFVALSQSQSKKSFNYHKVETIIFDEFIIERGFNQYINGSKEATTFMGLYMSVARHRGNTKVYFLSNSVSIMNPYFLQYSIDPDDGEFIQKFDGFVLAHIVDSKNFSEAVERTQLGRFMRATDPEYADYAIKNAFADNHDDMVKPKHPAARYLWTLETKQGIFSIWKATLERGYYAQAKRPKSEVVFTMIPENVTDKRSLVLTSDEMLRKLRTAWRTGNMHFDQKKTRNMFTEVFK